MKKNPDANQLTLFSAESQVDTVSFQAGFDPARLTQARELAGLTKQGLAEKIGVTGAAIGQYEARVHIPAESVMLSLAKELGYPVSYFLSGRPRGQVDASEAHFRSLRSTRLFERLKAVSFVESVWELIVALGEYVEFPEVNVPTIEQSSDNMSPQEAAGALREYWNLGDGPIGSLTGLLEHEGIVVTGLNFSASGDEAVRIDAFSTGSLDRPIIVTTSERSASVYRHRFTCAHEVGHLVLHRDVVSGDSSQEREADAFAAEFLTPRSAMETVLPQTINLSRLDEISSEWGVSVEALIRRMQEIRGASDISVRRAYQKVREQRKIGTRIDPSPAGSMGETPTILQRALLITEESGTSLVDIANVLSWPVSKLQRIVGLKNKKPKLRIIDGL